MGRVWPRHGQRGPPLNAAVMQHVKTVRAVSKTESEALFEAFCLKHSLNWHPIPVGASKTPDYRLMFGGAPVIFEIEQIESRKGLDPVARTGSRVVGDHVRNKISEARKQIQAASEQGWPAVLLIYNTVDPLQAFGTEPHDFICAMYGELTVRLSKSQPPQSFHGRNAKLRQEMNTSFSGVGHLKKTRDGAEVVVYENCYARHPLPFESMPECFGLFRVEIEHAA